VSSEVVPAPDSAGRWLRHKTAVLLIAPRPNSWSAYDGMTLDSFVPLVCAIDGVLATGVKCGEIMPPRATVRTAIGPLVVARSTKPFHDDAG
jgi:hypothetical protein